MNQFVFLALKGNKNYTPGISERASETSKTYHTDALGSTRGITNGSQTVTDTVLYDAFGMTVNRTGSTPTPFGFVGGSQYQTDSDSGLMLLGNRYYDASVGRFISSDPIQAGTNWYAYCDNRPTVGADPKGLDYDITLHYHLVPGTGIGVHVWIEIIGTNKGFVGPILRTISGQPTYNPPRGFPPDWGQIRIIPEPARSQDIAVTPIPVERGKEDVDFVYKDLVAIGNTIPDTTYKPLGPNSNSVAYTIIAFYFKEHNLPPPPNLGSPAYLRPMFPKDVRAIPELVNINETGCRKSCPNQGFQSLGFERL